MSEPAEKVLDIRFYDDIEYLYWECPSCGARHTEPEAWDAVEGERFAFDVSCDCGLAGRIDGNGEPKFEVHNARLTYTPPKPNDDAPPPHTPHPDQTSLFEEVSP